MAEVLSQNEIDALISAMVSDVPRAEQRPAATDPMAGRKVRAYDFKRPDKFSKDQLRTLHMLHENYARLLTTYFTGTFRTMVQMVIGSVDQNTYGEFIRSVSNPSVLAVFKLDPLASTCVLDIHPALAFPMLDRLFGGPGATVTQVRPVTEIEQSVLLRVIQGTLEALREAWRNIIDVTPSLDGVESNPLFVQVVAPSEIVVTIAIDVRVGDHVGVITLCLPFVTLEPILARLSAHNWFATTSKEMGEDALAHLRGRMSEVRVPLVAELGQAHLSIGQILDLQPGDVVVLDQRVSDSVMVYVGNKPKFAGQPGRAHGRLAVQIQQQVEEGGEEESGW